MPKMVPSRPAVATPASNNRRRRRAHAANVWVLIPLLMVVVVGSMPPCAKGLLMAPTIIPRNSNNRIIATKVVFPSPPSYQIKIQNQFATIYTTKTTTTVLLEHNGGGRDNANDNDSQPTKSPSSLWLAPLWTMLASAVGILPLSQPTISTTLGQLLPLQISLAVLMLAMGLTITPKEIQAATQQPHVLITNMACCFGFMPLLGWWLCVLFHPTLLSTPQTIGTCLLASVSGGQASNLFSLLAGGDVALSVICTLSTTMVGVVATPLLISQLLGTSIPIQLRAMMQSVATLVLLPLVSGLTVGRIVPLRLLQQIQKWCPRIGLLATMILVAGGASNAAASLQWGQELWSTILISFLLPSLGGIVAYGLGTFVLQVPKPSQRTLTIEVLSKSPTLAHVLALRHFGVAAASIPAASMVSLAVLGALVASVWQSVDPI